MVVILSYEGSMRVAYLLGEENNKTYFISSSNVPADVVPVLASKLSNTKSLSERIEILKREFPFVYNKAFRSVRSSKLRIVERYEN